MAILDSMGTPLPPTPKPTDVWEKARAAASIVSAIVIPIVLLWIGNNFSTALKERELQGKFIELAVQILREEPTKQAAGLRDWATQVLNNYSGVPFTLETKRALIENTPLPSSSERYEGRKDLGNIEVGDGVKFIGRGYLGIVGRTNYERFSKLLGIDLLSSPERADDAKIAASVLALWFKEREEKYTQALLQGNQVAARRMTVGGAMLLETVATRYKIYLSLLERSPLLSGLHNVDGVTNPAWISVHLPILIAAFNEYKLGSIQVRAYALATAEVETSQGQTMKERP